MEDDARTKLLERAARCRRLAADLPDADIAASLIRLADEYEEAAQVKSDEKEPDE